MENWRDIRGHEGRYQVSDLGRVRSLDREIAHPSGSTFVRKGKVLTVHFGERGYGQVTLTGGGRWKTYMVHRLVAEAFLPPKAEGEVVRHKDGEKPNNALANLQYGTHQQNSNDQKRHGTTRKGSDHPMAKLTEADVLALRASAGTTVALAEAYGVSNQLVSRIKRREIWRHI